MCSSNATSAPFTCSLKFGSWIFDKSGINLTTEIEGIDTTSYIPNDEWKLT
ncbi:unnamed protein product, partial [Adineta steineri]